MVAPGVGAAQAFGAHRLDAGGNVGLGGLGGELLGVSRWQDRPRGVAGAQRLADGADGPFSEQLRRFEAVLHAGQLPRQSLVPEDGLAEGLTLGAVPHSSRQRRLDHGAAHGRDIGAGAVDAGHGGDEGLARRADQVVGGGDVAVEPEAAGADQTPARQLVRRQPLESGPGAVDEERCNAAAPRARVGLRVAEDHVGVRGVGDPGFGAVEPPAAVCGCRRGGDVGEVAAGTWFGERSGAEATPRHQVGQVALAVSVAAEPSHPRRHVAGVHQAERERHRHGAEHFHNPALLGEAHAQPAQRRGHFHRQQPDPGRFPQRLRRHALLALPTGHVRRHDRVAEVRNLANERFERRCVHAVARIVSNSRVINVRSSHRGDGTSAAQGQAVRPCR